MAEQAPARRGNVFTQRIGPLPMWVWVTIIAAVLLGYGLIKGKKPTQSTTGTGTSSTTNASQVPEFVNQTYTTVTPPTAPTNATSPSSDHENQPGPPGAHPGANPLLGTQTITPWGMNVGSYQVGPQQVQLIQGYAKAGQFGVTSGEAADVAQAYQNAVSKYGPTAAATFHYGWIGPGNVTAQSGSQTVGRVL